MGKRSRSLRSCSFSSCLSVKYRFVRRCGMFPHLYTTLFRCILSIAKVRKKGKRMLVFEYKLDATKQQYRAIDEAIRVVQFIRNKCLRLWMDERSISKNDLQRYCAVLAQDFSFATHLNSQARQASADRAWFAISHFYENCKNHEPGKKGYPKFQHDNRSVEYKQTGWKLEADGRHITFTDGCDIGRLRLVGNPGQKIEAFPLSQIKRGRIVRRADGYYCEFAVQATRQNGHQPS